MDGPKEKKDTNIKMKTIKKRMRIKQPLDFTIDIRYVSEKFQLFYLTIHCCDSCLSAEKRLSRVCFRTLSKNDIDDRDLNGIYLLRWNIIDVMKTVKQE